MTFTPGDDDHTWIAVYQCIVVAAMLAVLGWLAYNFWTILVQQRKWRVIPLSTFYSLAALLVIFDMFKVTYYFTWTVNYEVVFFLYGQTLKFLLTVDQIWINIELIYSIRYSLQAATIPNPSFPARRLKIGRVVVLASIVLLSLTALVIFITATSTLSDDARMSFCNTGNEVYVLALQITAFVSLSSSIIVILVNLSKLKDYTNDK